MTDVSADMEDVYRRAEKRYSTIERQIQWLGSFSAGGSYADGAITVAENLAEAQGIRQKASSSKNVEVLEGLMSDAEDITFKRVKKETVDFVGVRLNKAIQIQEESKMAREGATEKKLRGEIKNASTESEFARILRGAEDEVSESGYNRLSGEVDKRLKEIRYEKAEVARQERERLAKERIDSEKKEASLQKIKEDKAEEVRKDEARQIQRKRAAEIEAEKRLEEQRAIQREIDKEVERAIRDAQENS